MKITHNKVGQNLNLTDSGRANKTSKAGKADSASGAKALENLAGAEESSTDSRVNLSERAMDIKKAKEIAMATPDVREDKVAELQKLIDSGKYKVDAKEIADKMVDEEMQWT